MRLENAWRYSMLGSLFVAVAVAIMLQTVRLQFSPQAKVILDGGSLFSGAWQVIDAPRGQIYDRWGNLLAGNHTVYEISVELRSVENPKSIAFILNGTLGLDYNQVLAAVSQQASDQMVNVTLVDNVPADKALLLQQYMADLRANPVPSQDGQENASLVGLVFRPHLQRSYPEKDLAANVLGFVSREGIGYFGVEGNYDDLLAGVPKLLWIPSDPNLVEELPEIPPGASLVLTIDREIQASVEHILDDAVEKNGAKGGSVVVMDPKTGEIYAMASSPRIDLNEFWRYPEVFPGSNPFNRAVSQSYEPGSVFKVLTMAAAIDSGQVKADTPFLDTGYFEVGGIIIRNWDSAAWGQQDMLGCMQHSLNVCLAWVGTEMGASVFYDYMTRFGFGHVTGVDLAGEADGRLKSPGDGDWYPADLGTNTFGQGVSVTPIQMLMAVSAIANRGQMVTPHIVRSLVDNGNQYDIQPQYAGMPISKETAEIMSEMLAISLENEGSEALVSGYRMAGKTGTAEIPGEKGYTREITNTSFIGWGPVDDPRFIVYVWLEQPTSSIWGSVVAAPVFKEVVERLVVLLNLPPDVVRFGLTHE
ncbi:MAG: penicillin-binding protein 2 [Anaerolineae bacterium]|nr:penicillin-binding protein 2 [Anaerolineae bacterium]